MTIESCIMIAALKAFGAMGELQIAKDKFDEIWEYVEPVLGVSGQMRKVSEEIGSLFTSDVRNKMIESGVTAAQINAMTAKMNEVLGECAKCFDCKKKCLNQPLPLRDKQNICSIVEDYVPPWLA